MRNVCFLFGVNGVGKSTLANAIAASVDGAVTVSGSAALRAAFGGVSREELERIDPARKRAVRRDALAEEFARHSRAPLVVCDAHLVVPIRGEGGVRYEHMWDEEYLAHGVGYCNVTAPCADVVARRIRDVANGRVRAVDVAAIEEDLRVNDAAFRAVFGGEIRAFSVRNVGAVEEVARGIVRRVLL